jgi:hypothetical protein
MHYIFSAGLAINKDIIKVGSAEDIKVILQGIINKSLKGCGCSYQPKGHY